MTKIRTGVRIARKLQESEHAIDHAMIAVSALIQTMIEGRLDVGVAAQTGHLALDHAVVGLNRLQQVRGNVIAGHDALKDIAEAAGIPYAMDGTQEPKFPPTGRLAVVQAAA
ncbi:MAG: hypothetical protein Q8S03_05905 [Brevundimonas sp.]|uniref:hypothetical protein n=1 Tax=Brevundimonas sp. TaxID=1871086 RepID=UPI0027354700|nr:hypothetical protein [Brevundimonas sp.]MBX9616049.1 hypothetical protein [Caulobacteraceae bacterium]MDP3404206.1 hypothetical protein [Brevundimonas sp.]